ncbi:mitochondrial chaperone BCS1-like [Daktulosphaira vitifoliae]|uniref:mitochondrial chaperone BCS1-like n=1 Tax=Daktulosphaira vitifoliae TaxID=58002 RepID=UPI0021AABA29|nr:mitochondrial chaperone BCS1-like [Daktulosphaira vitifoliae]
MKEFTNFSALVQNAFFFKITQLVGVSIASYALSEAYGFVKGYLWRNYVTELEVANSDQCYYWLLQWLADNNNLFHFSVTTKPSTDDSSFGNKRLYVYEPSSGEHVIKYKGHSISLNRTRSAKSSNSYESTYETIQITVWGKKKEILNEMLNEAMKYAMSQLETGTTIFVPSYDMWQSFGEPRIPRSKLSIILDDGVYDGIMNDIQNFHNGKSWYQDRGIPYRRGYLLYGPPGCGKSSLITALAGELNYNICVLSLNDTKMSDEQLLHLMASVPSQSLVLLEDVDSMFSDKEGTTVIEGNKVTLSGLLNAFDGIVSSEGRILFMTTNYIERLDPALIRPGRVDYKLHIGPCTDYQLKGIFDWFRPDDGNQNKKKFVSEIKHKNKPITPAQLQGYFLRYRDDDITEILNNLNNLWEEDQNIQSTK